MKNFYRTSTWVLMILISVATCFWGGFSWQIEGFNLILGVKTMLALSLILTIANLPEIVVMLVNKRKDREID